MNNNNSRSASRSRTNERRYSLLFAIMKEISKERIEITLLTETIEEIVWIVAKKAIAEIDT